MLIPNMEFLAQRRKDAKNTCTHYFARLRLCVMILLVLLSSMMAFGQQRQSDANTVFRSARDLITDGEWAKAQEKFSQLVETYPNDKNIEAALYWLAYTQQKLAKYDDCR